MTTEENGRETRTGRPSTAFLGYGLDLILGFMLIGFLAEGKYTVPVFLVGFFFTSIIYLTAVREMSKGRIPPFWFVLLIACLIRIIVVQSAPILSDEHQRHLWDGYIVSNLLNPYSYTPDEIQSAAKKKGKADVSKEEPDAKSAFARLYTEAAAEKDFDVRRIPNSGSHSVHTPGALLVSGVSALVRPFDENILKIIALLLDLLVGVIIALILRELGKPASFALIYLWCPLPVKEFANSGNPEVLGVAFLALAVFFIIRRKQIASIIFFALTIATKIQVLLLLPVLIRKFRWRQTLFILPVILAAAYLPFILTTPDWVSDMSALVGIGNFNFNSGAFGLISFGISKIVAVDLVYIATGGVVVLIYLTALSYFMVRIRRGACNWFQASFAILALLVVFSPVIHSWHLIWLLPFLAVRLRWSWLVLAATIVLSCLLDAGGRNPIWIRWLEFLPFIIVWSVETFRRKWLELPEEII